MARRRDPRGGARRLVVTAQAAFQGVHGLSRAPDRSLLPGLALAVFGAIAFSGKAIIVKLAYRYGVDAVTLIMLRMLFALPIFLLMAWWASRGKPPLTGRDWLAVIGLGISGYYLSSFLDFLGNQSCLHNFFFFNNSLIFSFIQINICFLINCTNI